MEREEPEYRELRRGRVTARKEWRCDTCASAILAGEPYHHLVYVLDGKIDNCRTHLRDCWMDDEYAAAPPQPEAGEGRRPSIESVPVRNGTGG